jgi:flagellar basal-body rod protein FlgB
MSHALDFRLQRNNIVAANLANIDTPGYTPVELKFEDQLKSFLEGDKPVGMSATHERHLTHADPIEQGEMEFDAYSLPDQKGNSVDLDHESSKLAENQLMYRTIITAYNKRMSLLQFAVREGK